MRWAMWILLALMVPGVAQAQTSPAQRAQQLAKLEEDLNSPDPNLRLATLEWAMESKSIAIRTKAMAVALSSSDAQMNAVGLRYKVCSASEILIRNGYDPNGRHNSLFNGFRAGQIIFRVKSCNPTAGSASLSYTDIHNSQTGVATMQVRDRSLYINFLTGKANCAIGLTLQAGQQMVGRLSCPYGSGSFGPVEARFDLN